MADTRIKFELSENELPRQWYNLLADAPFQLEPPISPRTLQPATPHELLAIFPMEVIKQEASTERYIPIPEEVRDIYRIYRPTPLLRARRLEQLLDTPAHIYYKYEGASPVGSHKPNTAIPQAYYNRQAGIKRLSTETGAGQWGSALAMSCAFFGLECQVYMVKVSYNQKPFRRHLMETYGAGVFPSPSDATAAGRAALAQNPNSLGSLGLAISEAIEDAVGRDDTNYSLGSVLNHVLLHQTVIGEESLKQMDLAGAFPDVVIGCVGGGSNFGGLAFPFLREKFAGRKVRVMAVEPAACPTLTRGVFAYDYADVAGLTPIIRMYTLGHKFEPSGIHAGGLRFHGSSPIVSHLYNGGHIEARAYGQIACFEAALMFARSEGLLPAPESSHAIRAAIDEALEAKEAGEQRNILFGLSGHGNFDLTAYEAYTSGKLVDYEHPQEEIDKALAQLPQVPQQ